MLKFIHKFGLQLVFLCFIAACFPSTHTILAQPMVTPQSQSMPLLPFLDYYIDQSFSLDIEEAAALGRKNAYQPLNMNSLPETEGIMWLRFTLAPTAPGTRIPVYLLDLGSSIPGEPLLFEPVQNELSGAQEWVENTPAQRNIMLLPEARGEAMTCYIRLDGLPGPWFAPMLRTPEDAASNWSSLSRTGAILALAVVMLLCLLRGLSERGEWRIWTGLYVAVALTQAIVGIPTASGGFTATRLLGLLCPGVALMLLPHVGRHLMAMPRHSRNLDLQLLLLSLPGAALALLPLFPGWSWLERWVDLWPAATIIFVPTALAAWIMGPQGAKRFLAGCLLPPLFVAVAYFGLDFGLPANLLSSLPLWGVALSALLIIAAPAPAITANEKTSLGDDDAEDGGIINLKNPVPPDDHPRADPNLRIVSSQEGGPMTMQIGLPDISFNKTEKKTPPMLLNEEGEMALRTELDEIIRQGAALGGASLPTSARKYAEDMISASERLAHLLAGEVPDRFDAQGSGESGIFNLQHLIREAHDSVAPAAEEAGIALSWYMPPMLCQLYNGSSEKLAGILKLLLESSVRSTAKGGMVHLAVRRAPQSSDPGLLLFAIEDNGHGYPPINRSSSALARLWELLGEDDGFLSVDAGPNGAYISFSARFTPLEEETETMRQEPALLLAADNLEERKKLARMLAGLPYKIIEAGTEQEIIASQTAYPAAVMIAHGKFATPASADVAHAFTDLARKGGFSVCFLLAITPEDRQWNLLKPSGFTHAMLEPAEPETLESTVRKLMESIPEPVASPTVVADDKHDFSSETEQEEPPEQADNVLPDSFASQPLNVSASADSATAEEAESKASLKPEGVDKENAKDQDSEEFDNLADGPTMLIEQDLPLHQGFDGPSWLSANLDAGKNPDAETAETDVDMHSASSEPAGKTEAAIGDNAAALPETEGAELKPETAENIADSDGKPSLTAAADWVGEPQPLIKKEQPQEPNAINLTEYIVGVERQYAKNASRSLEDPAPEASAIERILGSEKNKDEPHKESASAEPRIDPDIVALVNGIDENLRNARAGFERKDCQSVAEGASGIVQEADRHALRVLSRLAQCVERAARNDDLGAVNDLLPDLEQAVERNRITLLQTGKNG